MIFWNELETVLVEKYGFVELYDEEHKISWLMSKSLYEKLIVNEPMGEDYGNEEK